MNKVITAEEFLKNLVKDEVNYENWKNLIPDIVYIGMIEFAKMHVKAALEKASEEATLNLNVYSHGIVVKTEDLGQEVSTEIPNEYIECNKDFILNCYPKELIK